jgi:YadA head domain repeat (2 copies)
MPYNPRVDHAISPTGPARKQSRPRLSRIAETPCGYSVALLASCAFVAAALMLSTAMPAMAGCNSGDIGTVDLLASANCQATASGDFALAIGGNALAASNDSLAIGRSAGPRGVSSANGAISIGGLASYGGAGLYSTAIGTGTSGAGGQPENSNGAHAVGDYSVAIGGGDDSVNRKGAETKASAVFGIAIGTGAIATGVRSTMVGAYAGSGARCW